MERLPYSVVIGDKRVDAWSPVRLPFEPKGWLRDYRSELQRALRSLTPTSTSVLFAEYGAPDDGFADLENVLLYNLGSGCYAHLARHGIVCRRTASTDQFHRVTYITAEPKAVIAPRGQILASARLTDMPTGSTPAHWWAALRSHLHTRAGKPYNGEFGIEVDAGSRWNRDLAPSVKVLLDGLVAALHVHDGSERDRVSTALKSVGDGDRLWTLLNNPEQATFWETSTCAPPRNEHRMEPCRRALQLLRHHPGWWCGGTHRKSHVVDVMRSAHKFGTSSRPNTRVIPPRAAEPPAAPHMFKESGSKVSPPAASGDPTN